MSTTTQTIASRLAAVVAGRIKHVYNGDCPDDVEGLSARDHECPACRVLIDADAAAQGVAQNASN